MRYSTGGGLTAAERRRREAVRMAAADDFDAGATDAQVARTYRVTRMSAWRWHHDYETGGRGALETKGPASRCRLTVQELDLLQQLLDLGPAAHGFADQRWTLARTRAVVAEHFDVTYSLAGMSLLLHRLGWSVQVPARRAAERDEEAVEQWRQQVWPRLRTSNKTVLVARWEVGGSPLTRKVRDGEATPLGGRRRAMGPDPTLAAPARAPS
ncbi:helix-turn-helix domain-containing protein [Nocardiopsis synnemataformans]|uniref:helix-turn-helix domain-containing protein n=1 Tax=Nocardiopsis synnemataformans TaxID=61305 RepID=UPI003EBDF180